jgi:organic hydroperoxide reductase OsmC/OhrA
MTSIVATEFETCLQWQGDQRATLAAEHAPAVPLTAMAADHPLEDRWCPETLLVGALEGRILQMFLQRAQAEGLEVLFYQSTAMGRRVEGQGGPAHFTDFIVRPHVAIASAKDEERVRRIFEELPGRCFPSSIMQLTPRIEPVVESWEDGPRAPERTVQEAHGSGPSA